MVLRITFATGENRTGMKQPHLKKSTAVTASYHRYIKRTGKEKFGLGGLFFTGFLYTLQKEYSPLYALDDAFSSDLHIPKKNLLIYR